MTPEQKIAAIEYQIAECETGKSNLIVCPYCKGENWKPGTGPLGSSKGLCCELFATAATAILDRQAQEKHLEAVERLVDKVGCN